MRREKNIDSKRFDLILNQILRYASGDFNFRGMVTPKGDKIDAVIGGLNMLGEEVNHLMAELKNANIKARESDMLKTAFLNNISHEIRTPVSIILGFVDILRESELVNEENKLYLETIAENANRLLYIINDIIDISCLELNTELITESEIHIYDFISNILKEFKFNHQNGKLSFINLYINNKCNKNIQIISDKVKLELVLNKLIDNAIKYTKKGEIEINYFVVESFLQFNIKDTGIGIGEDILESIFERFRQGDENLTRRYGGIGLGLTISKSLVELLGGKIWVNSVVGKGSEFSFTIPFKPAIKISGRQDSYIMKNISFNNIFKGKTILIAENELNNLIIFKKYLQATNANIIHANDGFQAIEQCLDNEVDIVLINTHLPKMDGIETASRIKKLMPGLPVISHTSNHFPDNREKSLQAGCVDHLPIPVHRKILLNKLNKHLFKT